MEVGLRSSISKKGFRDSLWLTFSAALRACGY
jgi:hypothetical protein